MKKNSVRFIAAALAVILTPMISLAQEAPTDVMQVFVVDVSKASEPLPPMFDRFSEVFKKYNSTATERGLWWNGYAGPSTGVFIGTTRYPSMEALAKDQVITGCSGFGHVPSA